MSDQCPLCVPDSDRVWMKNDIGFVLWDAFPVSEGHALVLPKQHAASLYELSSEQQAAMWELVAEVRQRLQDELHPDAFNIGLNDGVAAGQTIVHVHIHVIPRYTGDREDPKGGVRWIIPEKARYW